ncbi:hypothetical protein [Truepera radiovictrix]|uniref:Uncharacterized protein n=1 Tax=Truepera radiovictrix (strain DSM 17093 / CIP 108686 / LMG 22925 / RQ-24) TaxID=649638 RepID=D7CSX6_TRURR|nr:hypothetical protein [Truepera radiovictrix]ADI13743.1 hypothetical protein Trad_0607 [Truepera radiovictrix DSM 17093]WMT57693.1 hypothetical protein RCV51_01795 [Truepera radiovictrix]
MWKSTFSDELYYDGVFETTIGVSLLLCALLVLLVELLPTTFRPYVFVPFVVIPSLLFRGAASLQRRLQGAQTTKGGDGQTSNRGGFVIGFSLVFALFVTPFFLLPDAFIVNEGLPIYLGALMGVVFLYNYRGGKRFYVYALLSLASGSVATALPIGRSGGLALLLTVTGSALFGAGLVRLLRYMRR